MKSLKLTKAQQQLKSRFDKGERISKINKGQTFEYRFQDNSLCHYTTFWNLMRAIYGFQQPIEQEKYFL